MAALVAQVPGQKPATDALGNIAEYGILGSICVILIVALVFTVRALLKEKDRRFNDQKALLEVVEKHNENAKDLAIEATKSQAELQGTLSNQATALASVQTTLAGQTATMTSLTTAVNQLQGRSAG
jgi:uncharacterized protein HemX